MPNIICPKLLPKIWQILQIIIDNNKNIHYLEQVDNFVKRTSF